MTLIDYNINENSNIIFKDTFSILRGGMEVDYKEKYIKFSEKYKKMKIKIKDYQRRMINIE